MFIGCMYSVWPGSTILRVLSSVRGGGKEVMSEGGVFWWCSEYEDELCAVWEDVVLVLHTLEEKQLHIVKPVKGRMKTIVQATSTYINGEPGAVTSVKSEVTVTSPCVCRAECVACVVVGASSGASVCAHRGQVHCEVGGE